MAATIDVEDAYRRLLQEQGFDPIRQVFYRVIVSRYLVSGARSKRQFMTRLVDEEADIIWVLAADVAIDIYTLHVQGEAAEPAADLIARAVTSAKGAAVPLPSPELVEFVTGSNDLKSFLDSGRQSTADIVGALFRNGLSIEDMPSVLDFGCGCGRVLRNLSFLYKQSRWHGCDANATPLVWCKQALPAIEFVYNEGQGVMPYETNSMHLIYALSVFSHLDEGALSFWLGELHRILVPGGHFLMTILGTAYLHALSSEERNRFAAGEPVVQGLQNLGENGCAAYYPKSYVLSVTAPHFKLVDHIPGGAVGNGHQDLYLLQKS